MTRRLLPDPRVDPRDIDAAHAREKSAKAARSVRERRRGGGHFKTQAEHAADALTFRVRPCRVRGCAVQADLTGLCKPHRNAKIRREAMGEAEPMRPGCCNAVALKGHTKKPAGSRCKENHRLDEHGRCRYHRGVVLLEDESMENR